MELHIVATEHGESVFRYETGLELKTFVSSFSDQAELILHDNRNMFSSIASGSFCVRGMIIMPCSMATLGKLAACGGDSLLIRAADCCLKERVRLVVVPRETPLHSTHLRNMLTLSELGAVIVPPVPTFYAKDTSMDGTINGIVGRVLKASCIENDLYMKWGESHD